MNPARQKEAKSHANHISTRMWPLGHILAADPRPEPRIRGLLEEIRGAFAPLISSLLSLSVFAYKRQGFILKRGLKLSFSFSLCHLRFRLFVR